MLLRPLPCLLIAAYFIAQVPALAGDCAAHYPFDGSLADTGPNGFDGEFLDKNSDPAVGVRFEPGVDGQALRLGGQAFVRTPLNLSPDDCPQFTITAWVFFESQAATINTLLSTGVGDGPRLDRAGHSLRAYAGSTIMDAPANTARPGIWVFVAGTWDYPASKLRLYWHNRYRETNLPSVKQAPQEFFWIGANGYYGDVHYVADNILIDELRVHDRVLAPLEIAALQEDAGVRTVARVPVLETGPDFGGGATCNAHYPFNGNLKDISGNRYHGRTIDLQNNLAPGALDFVPGKHGQALRLDGAAAMVAPLDLHYGLCPRVTVTAWVYFEQEPAGNQTLTSSGYGSGPRLGTVGPLLEANGGSNLIRSKSAFAAGEWVFVAGAWDYESGVFSVITPAGGTGAQIVDYSTPPQQDFWIGVNGYLSGLNVPATNIRIDDVRVYGRLLDAAELAAVATNAPDEKYAVPGPTPDDDSGSLTGFGGRELGGISAGAGADPLGMGKPGEAEVATESTPRTVADMQKDAERSRDLAAGVAEPDLQPQGEMPSDPIQDSDEWKEAATEAYQQQEIEKFENNFGPRERAQVVVGRDGRIAFAAEPYDVRAGPSTPPVGGVDIENWIPINGALQELIRFKGTNSYMAVGYDGVVAIQGDTGGAHVAVRSEIATLVTNGRKVDLVAQNRNAFLIVSGTHIVSQNLPAAAKSWLQGELDDRAQVTAFSFLGDGAWIGASQRDVGSGAIHRQHWGMALRDKVVELQAAGERIEDISAAWKSDDDGIAIGDWAVATDQRIYYQNSDDCDNHEDFGFINVEIPLDRAWNCYVPVEACPSNRPTWSFNNMESPANKDVWDVNVLVTIGVADYDGEEKARFDCWLEESLRRTEELFDRSPAMKIHLKTRRETVIAGQNLSQMVFASGGDYRRYMEDNFDIVAPTETSGYFQVIVTDNLCAPDCIGGRATFPHSVEPFSRKYGIAVEPSSTDDTILAHEFGHYLGLKHTFEPYGITTNTCNKDYDANWLKMEDRHCRSCLSGMNLDDDTCEGLYNVMDYCENPSPPQQVYVNDCQERRASNQRDRYMKNDGRTKYSKMKGAQ